MKVPRFIGFVDLGIITVILVFAVLPPRERFATPAIDKAKLDETKQFALALAEARVIVVSCGIPVRTARKSLQGRDRVPLTHTATTE